MSELYLVNDEPATDWAWPLDEVVRINRRWSERNHIVLESQDDLIAAFTREVPAKQERKEYADGAELLHKWMVHLWHTGATASSRGTSLWTHWAKGLTKLWRKHEKNHWYLENAELFQTFKASALQKWRKHIQKENMALWSPTTYLLASNSRSAKNVESLSMVVLDMDDGSASMDEVIQYWKEQCVTCICHESFGSTPEHPKFRVIIPLRSPIPVKLWPALWREVSVETPGEPDEACKDASRIYYKNYGTFSGPGKVKTTIWSPLDWEARDLQPIPTELPRFVQLNPQPRNPLYENEVDYTLTKERVDLAQRLGARLSDTRAYNIRCPQCNEHSVWFYLEAGAKNSAGCNHRNSCGWNGGLWRLAK